MRYHQLRAVWIFLLLILAMPKLVASAGISDPCKLLSKQEIRDTLGLTRAVLLEPTGWTPQFTVSLVDAGFGTLGYSFDETALQKDNRACIGRSGDLKLLIQIRSTRNAEADDEKNRKGLQLLQKKWGYRIERTIHGAITCEERFAPPSDLAAWRRDGMICFQTRGEQRLSIWLQPWTPMAKEPVAVQKLELLVSKAASRL